ncbi:MAG: tRNA (N6-isopentenyl adenosine(37)-C2)-methylthiotransferase MiaB [Alphaproteobacteria bacterium]|nr:tRNA (N6-isopentenyl adenosine(37)-C2)-methylthiotransferase MiaB [Alphaproteobacteria bacterium]MCB9696369.1 tRNA (N6-isopentenyl adenosine(37)-C2)-methylthiotransferase MiaB [Alphaproteobacteria bacterium]
MGKVFVHSLGCQMNEVDSGKIRAQLALDGWTATDDPEQADLVLVNTCSVREKAVDKMHSTLGEYRRMKRSRPGMRVGIVGCVAQERGAELIKKYRDVDLVFGPDGVPKVRELVRASEQQRVLDTEFLDLEAYPFVQENDPLPSGIGAFVTIQKGCDNKCTFCIVPSTRGAEASRPHAQIVDEVRAMVDAGAREITLIGQNVNSYGLKTPGEITFAELLYRVAAVPGVQRIRYTTSHPRDMGPDVLRAHAEIEALCPQLHLPVQSGSNAVLRRMKRYYTREHYLKVVDELRRARPDIVLTTDVIVGFPGETDEDFEHTMSLLDEVGFVGSFSFKYSPRPGTPALKLQERGEVAPEVASARLLRYQDRQRELSTEWHRSLEGTEVDVLVEGPSRHDEGVVCGRTPGFAMVNFPGDVSLVGSTVRVRVTRGFTHSCRAEPVA